MSNKIPNKDFITEIRMNRLFTSLVLSKESNDIKLDNIPIIRKHIISTPTFLKKVENSSIIINDDMIPLNCRYSKYLKNNSKLFVIEENPKLRTILVDLDMGGVIEKLRLKNLLTEFGYENFLNENQKPYKFILSFPYIVYIIILDQDNNVDSFKIFFRLSPITGRSDYLLKANLLNMDRDQKVCLGGEENIDYTMNEACENVIYNFWSSSFNMDYNYNVVEYTKLNGKVSDYLTWMYYTKKDPMFIFDTNWINHKYTLGKEINRVEVKDDNIVEDFRSFDFRKLKDFLINVQAFKNKKGIRYENICVSYAFENGILSVGDSFIFENEELFVNSFSGFSLSKLPTIIIAETINGKVLSMEIKIISKEIEKQLKERNYIASVKLKNGTIIKKNDILKISYPFELYKTVQAIRKSRDDKIEIILNGDYYLAEHLEAEIFDVSKPEYNEIVLNTEEVYIIGNLDSSLLSKRYDEVKFLKIDNKQNQLSFIFEDISNRIDDKFISLNSLESRNSKLYKKCSLQYVQGIFRMGASLFSSYDKTILLADEGYLVKGNLNTPTVKEVFEQCVNSTKENLRIFSFDYDLNFKIGDSVVIANWRDPESMLLIYHIISFKYNEESDIIEIWVKEENKNIKKIEFIKKGENDLIKINIGSIRKIQTEYNGVNAGSKIKSKMSGISNFPKKDVNIIVGFLNDTGTSEPLVLCSNCCTLWYDELIANFDIISKNTTMWNKLKHSPIDLSKIKYQCGDCIADRDNFPKIVLFHKICKSLFKLYCYNFHDRYFYPLKINLIQLKISNTLRHGFITPRYSNSQIASYSLFEGIPNFHGSYTKKKTIDMKIPMFFTRQKGE